VDRTTLLAVAVAPPAPRAVNRYVWAVPSHAKYSSGLWWPPGYEANFFPSIARSTVLAPVAVHASWIIVGELQTGADGLIE
jgi:hypothetical protein